MFKSKTSTHEAPTYEVAKSDEEWRKELSPDRYAVLRQAGTEPAWTGDLLHVDGEGVFRCAGCGAELFDTDSKFDSGSGWPSFDRAKSAGTIIERPDNSSSCGGSRSSVPVAVGISATSFRTGRPRPGCAIASTPCR